MNIYLVWRAYGVFAHTPFQLAAMFDTPEKAASYINASSNGILRLTTATMNAEIPKAEVPR